MKLSLSQQEFIQNASSKSLATVHEGKPHVIPVSTLIYRNECIFLCNYYMNQTPKNIQSHPYVALSIWEGFQGFQIKGKAEYLDSGSLFEAIPDVVYRQHLERKIYGIIKIIPDNIIDIVCKK